MSTDWLTCMKRANVEAEYKQAVSFLADEEPTARDFPAAISLLAKAAHAEHVPAIRELGICILTGKGVEADEAQGREWIEHAAGLSDPPSMLLLSAFLDFGLCGWDKDMARAHQLVQRAAEMGYPAAQLMLSDRYFDGKGTTRCPKKAITWLHRAAEQGYAQAQLELGEAFRRGERMTQDTVEAKRWFRRAAAQGDKLAQGVLQSYGDTTPAKPPATATQAETTRAAAEGGDAHSQASLGLFHFYGLYGLPQDYIEAAHWMREAHKQGYTGTTDRHPALQVGMGVEASNTAAYKHSKKSWHTSVARVGRDSETESSYHWGPPTEQ